MTSLIVFSSSMLYLENNFCRFSLESDKSYEAMNIK